MNLHRTYYKVYLKDIPTFKNLENGIGKFFKYILSMEKIKEETKLEYILISISIYRRKFHKEYESNITWDNLIWEEIGWNPDDDDNGGYWYKNKGFIYKGNLASRLLRKSKLNKINSL